VLSLNSYLLRLFESTVWVILIAMIMQPQFQSFLRTLLWSSTILGATIGFMPLPAGSQQSPRSNNPPLDNIYHENDNLPDDADVFPRMGKIAGSEREQTNCRLSPWGRVVTQFSGNSFLEINRRQVDRNGESWFYNRDRNCWIHDSRIDLL
jgi:hypothetical protein